ncbi:type II toxin-antitoxin system RelE/ParE family toxin [Fimbriimonas ginsengisoli]|uniref:Plasmid stabilization system n=1 Tax=Fimbriimonas ginsengisoli Gsoil 348 TaxID=661478 RepID=A0A068NYB4_FIMGI|nr:hypothetical protein OP10G_3451 [Fimbriimonas ginsengisoli Gsoil 348]
MGFRVFILPQAEADAAEYAAYIAQDSPNAALKRIDGLSEMFEALSEMPERFTVIPEQGRFRRSYRQFHYHSHRVILFVDDAAEKVVVARVYHGSRDLLRSGDLECLRIFSNGNPFPASIVELDIESFGKDRSRKAKTHISYCGRPPDPQPKPDVRDFFRILR